METYLPSMTRMSSLGPTDFPSSRRCGRSSAGAAHATDLVRRAGKSSENSWELKGSAAPPHRPHPPAGGDPGAGPEAAPRFRNSDGLTHAATAGPGVNAPGSSSASRAITGAGSATSSG